MLRSAFMSVVHLGLVVKVNSNITPTSKVNSRYNKDVQ
jgi:hypothetical protein